MDQNAKYASSNIFEQVSAELEEMLKVPANPLPTDEIIPHVGLEVNVAGDEWIPIHESSVAILDRPAEGVGHGVPRARVQHRSR